MGQYVDFLTQSDMIQGLDEDQLAVVSDHAQRHVAKILGSRIRTTSMKLRNALSDILYH